MTHFMKNRTPTLFATIAVVGVLAAACAGYTAKLATITVRPDANLTANSNQQFVAEGRDERGSLFAITPAWSVVADGGTIDSYGMFTAGSTVSAAPMTGPGVLGMSRVAKAGLLASQRSSTERTIPLRVINQN